MSSKTPSFFSRIASSVTFNIPLAGTLKSRTRKLRFLQRTTAFVITTAILIAGINLAFGDILNPQKLLDAGSTVASAAAVPGDSPSGGAGQLSINKKYYNGADEVENINVKPSEAVTVRLKYDNKGTQAVNDVSIKDSLPAGYSFVPGSIKNCITPEPSDSVCSNSLSDSLFSGSNLAVSPVAGLYDAASTPTNGGTSTSATSGILEIGKKKYLNFTQCAYLKSGPPTDIIFSIIDTTDSSKVSANGKNIGARTNFSNTLVPLQESNCQPGITGVSSDFFVQSQVVSGGNINNTSSNTKNINFANKRYFDMSQCTYYTISGPFESFSSYLPAFRNYSGDSNTSNTVYVPTSIGGTNVSSKCGPVTGTNVIYDSSRILQPASNGSGGASSNTSTKSLDTLGNRYFNLSQCVYAQSSGNDLLNSALASVNIGAQGNNTRFSNDVDSVHTCGAGISGPLVQAHSFVKNLDMLDTTRGSGYIEYKMTAPSTASSTGIGTNATMEDGGASNTGNQISSPATDNFLVSEPSGVINVTTNGLVAGSTSSDNNSVLLSKKFLVGSASTTEVDKANLTNLSDPIRVRLKYDNTGKFAVAGVKITDTIPTGFSRVPNSIKNCITPDKASPVVCPAGYSSSLDDSLFTGQSMSVSPTAGMYDKSVASKTGITSQDGILEIGKKKFLNLQQCVTLKILALTPSVKYERNTYIINKDFFQGHDGNTGISNSSQSLDCYAGRDTYYFNDKLLSDVVNLDLTNNRYLNLMQCAYVNPNAGYTDYFTTFTPTVLKSAFGAMTTTSNSVLSSAICGNGGLAGNLGDTNDTYNLNAVSTNTNSGIMNLNLLGNRYLNLSQCILNGNFGYGYDDYLNTLVNTTPANANGYYISNTTTSNVPVQHTSNSATFPSTCTSIGGYTINPGNSGVDAIDTLDNTRGSGYIEYSITANAGITGGTYGDTSLGRISNASGSTLLTKDAVTDAASTITVIAPLTPGEILLAPNTTLILGSTAPTCTPASQTLVSPAATAIACKVYFPINHTGTVTFTATGVGTCTTPAIVAIDTSASCNIAAPTSVTAAPVQVVITTSASGSTPAPVPASISPSGLTLSVGSGITVATDAQIAGLTMTCTPASSLSGSPLTTCTSTLPANTSMPAGLALGVGTATPTGMCTQTGTASPFGISCTSIPTQSGVTTPAAFPIKFVTTASPAPTPSTISGAGTTVITLNPVVNGASNTDVSLTSCIVPTSGAAAANNSNTNGTGTMVFGSGNITCTATVAANKSGSVTFSAPAGSGLPSCTATVTTPSASPSVVTCTITPSGITPSNLLPSGAPVTAMASGSTAGSVAPIPSGNIIVTPVAPLAPQLSAMVMTCVPTTPGTGANANSTVISGSTMTCTGSLPLNTTMPAGLAFALGNIAPGGTCTQTGTASPTTAFGVSCENVPTVSGLTATATAPSASIPLKYNTTATPTAATGTLSPSVTINPNIVSVTSSVIDNLSNILCAPSTLGNNSGNPVTTASSITVGTTATCSFAIPTNTSIPSDLKLAIGTGTNPSSTSTSCTQLATTPTSVTCINVTTSSTPSVTSTSPTGTVPVRYSGTFPPATTAATSNTASTATLIATTITASNLFTSLNGPKCTLPSGATSVVVGNLIPKCNFALTGAPNSSLTGASTNQYIIDPNNPVTASIAGQGGTSDDCTIAGNGTANVTLECANVPTLGITGFSGTTPLSKFVNTDLALPTLAANKAPISITNVPATVIAAANLTAQGTCSPSSIVVGTGTITCEFPLSGDASNNYSLPVSPNLITAKLPGSTSANCTTIVGNGNASPAPRLVCSGIPTIGASIPSTANTPANVTLSIGTTLTSTTAPVTLSSSTVTIGAANLQTGTCTPSPVTVGALTTCEFPLVNAGDASFANYTFPSGGIQAFVSDIPSSKSPNCSFGTTNNGTTTVVKLTCSGIPTANAVAGSARQVFTTLTNNVSASVTIDPVSLTSAQVLSLAPVCGSNVQVNSTATCTIALPAGVTFAPSDLQIAIGNIAPGGTCVPATISGVSSLICLNVPTGPVAGLQNIRIISPAAGISSPQQLSTQVNLSTTATTYSFGTAQPFVATVGAPFPGITLTGGNIPAGSLPMLVNLTMGIANTPSYAVISGNINSAGNFVTTDTMPATVSGQVIGTLTPAAVSNSVTPLGIQGLITVPATVNTVGSTTNAVTGQLGSTFPSISLTGCNLTSSPVTGFFLPATSNTVVIGQITQTGAGSSATCSFVPNSGSIIPTDIKTLGQSATGGTLTTASGNNVGTTIPTNFSAPASTPNNPGTTIATPSNPVTTAEGSTLPNITLSGCSVVTGTTGSFVPSGSTTPITGTYTNNGNGTCTFTPAVTTPAQVIPVTVTNGPSTSVLNVTDANGNVIQSTNIPTNFTVPASTPNNPGTTIATPSNPVTAVEGAVLPNITLSGCNVTTGTTGTFVPSGSTTPITGTYTNNGNGTCTFVPSVTTPAQVIPASATNGPSTSVLNVTDANGNVIQSTNVPTNFTVPATNPNNQGTPSATPANPITTTEGSSLPPIITLSGCNLPTGTRGVFVPAGTTTSITGTYTNTSATGTPAGTCTFVPAPGQIIPVAVTNGPSTSVLSVTDASGNILQSTNIPTNFTVPGSSSVAIGSISPSNNPVSGTVGQALPSITLVGSTYQGPANFLPQVPSGTTATPITGNISNGIFTPAAGQTIPSNVSTGSATGTIVVPNQTAILAINIPTNFTTPGGTNNNAASSSSSSSVVVSSVAISSSSITNAISSSSSTANNVTVSSSSVTTSQGVSQGTSTGTSTANSTGTSNGTSQGTSATTSTGTSTTNSTGTSTGTYQGTSTTTSTGTSTGTSTTNSSATTSQGTSTGTSATASTATSTGTSTTTSTGTSQTTSTTTSQTTTISSTTTPTPGTVTVVPAVVTTGGLFPALPLPSNCGIANGTVSTATLPGSVTSVSGTVQNCIFVPNPGTLVPSDFNPANTGSASVTPTTGGNTTPIPVTITPTTVTPPAVTPGQLAPVLTLPANCGIANGTASTATLPGSTVVITGTVQDCKFVPTPGTLVPAALTPNSGTTAVVTPTTGGNLTPIPVQVAPVVVTPPSVTPPTVTPGQAVPVLTLPANCGIANGTATTATLPGSTTVINGTVQNCTFVPSQGSTVPNNVSLTGGGSATVTNPAGGTILVPVTPNPATNPAINNPNIIPGTPTITNPSTGVQTPITPSNPLVVTSGSLLPPIAIPGCTVSNGSPASMLLPGSTTQVTGTIQDCKFVPSTGTIVPSDVTLGSGNSGTIIIPGVGTINVPLSPIAGANTLNNPGTPVVTNPSTGQLVQVTPLTPITVTGGGVVPQFQFQGGNVPNTTSLTQATLTCSGSQTPISGTISGNNFVPNAGSTYPTNTTLGNTTCTIKVAGGPSVSIPVNITPAASLPNNPGTPTITNPSTGQQVPVSPANPLPLFVGNTPPTIPLSGGNVPNGTEATLYLPGSSTPITGTISGNNFVPNAGQVIPSDVTSGEGNMRLVVKNGPTLSVPVKVGSKNDPANPVVIAAKPVNNLNATPATTNTTPTATNSTTAANSAANTNNSGTTGTTNPGIVTSPVVPANNQLGNSRLLGNPDYNGGIPFDPNNQVSQAIKTPLPSAADEDKGPNSGDGNYDGIKDSQQDNVVTIPTALGGSYVTSVFSGEGECSKPESYMATTEPEMTKQDSAYQYIYGLTGFKVKCSSAVTMKQYWHGIKDFSKDNYTFRKLGNKTPGNESTKEYFAITPTLSTENLGGKQVATSTYTVTDGEFGDDTAKDGIIIDPAGPALDSQSLLKFLPRTGGSMNIILIATPILTILVLSSIAYSKRKRLTEEDMG